MKVSLNWAKAQSNVPLSDIGVAELIEKIGAQLGAIEEVVHFGPRYEGIVVAKVISCVKHPDADKLSICKIDDNHAVQDVERDDNGLVQVVCGAPNVQAGLTVAWLPPGATVPASLDKDPFVLEARAIRGQVSNGMLASASELAISDNHDGILVIDEKDGHPGQDFKELYGLDDVVIDIENKMFTHRPDCFGVLGVARELAGIQGKQFESPGWYLNEQCKVPDQEERPLTVTIDEPTLVPRFMAVSVKDVTVGPSPTWLQAGLARVGLKPINNIVDITNYMMYLTGQPLHAYDADKLPGKDNLGARLSRKGEKVNLLNGKTVELKDDSTVVITSNDTVIGIGGVMGGKDTEVIADTKNIVIECASFDMYNIRRTSMKYGLFTDAVTRFNKGQSTLQNTCVLAKAISMVEEMTGGLQASKMVDIDSNLTGLATVEVDSEFINSRLGSSLSDQNIIDLLSNVEFDIVAEEKLRIVAPFWRTDIESPEDIVEEVGRLYGFDNLPVELPPRPSKPASRNRLLELKTRAAQLLSAAGANEVLTYSFVHGNLLEKVGQSPDLAFQLSNAISPDLQYFRKSLTPSLLDLVHPNVKAGYNNFAVFEIGVTHNKSHTNDDNGLPKEFPSLALVCASTTNKLPAYYQAKAYLEYLGNELGLDLHYDSIRGSLDFPVAKPYELTRSALVTNRAGGQVIGVVGELKSSVLRSLKLPAGTAAFELDLSELSELVGSKKYQKLSKYPSVQQDISLRVPAAINFNQVAGLLAEELLNKDDLITSLSPIDIYQRPDDAEHLQYTFRLSVSNHNKTLKSEEVNALLEAAAQVAHDKLSAERL